MKPSFREWCKELRRHWRPPTIHARNSVGEMDTVTRKWTNCRLKEGVEVSE